MLDILKKTVARVEVDEPCRPNGTAFLVERHLAATARHVLDGHKEATLVFVDWEEDDRQRRVTGVRLHPGHDLAILELDRACPEHVAPLELVLARPERGERWMTFGFPREVPDGHVLPGDWETVADPTSRDESLEERLLQLRSMSAGYDLGGFSGAPCVVRGFIVGVLTDQLHRAGGDFVKTPSLDTVYALPAELLLRCAPELVLREEFASDADLRSRLLYMLYEFW